MGVGNRNEIADDLSVAQKYCRVESIVCLDVCHSSLNAFDCPTTHTLPDETEHGD